MRWRTVGLAVLLTLASACGDSQGSVLSQAPPIEVGSDTTAPLSGTTAGPVATSVPVTSTPTPSDVDLTVIQVLARYDGARPLGTFEATVCNLGTEPAESATVEIGANGVIARVEMAGIGPRACADAFDPQMDFAAFGVADGQAVAVGAQVASASDTNHGNDGFEGIVEVDRVGSAPLAEQTARYDECRGQGMPHDRCSYEIGVWPLAEPHEVMKRGGAYASTVPADHEPIASKAVAIMAMCFPRLEEYMGIPLDRRYAPIGWRFGVGGPSFGTASGQIELWTDDSYLAEAAGTDLPHFDWANYLDGDCLEAHELAHVMVVDTPIPAWLNEGLAVHMSSAERVGWYSQVDHRCEPDGYVDINPYMDTETFKTYADLQGGWGFEDREAGDYYTTGSCFWEWFEDAYGHGAFVDVMQMLVDNRDPTNAYPGCPGFIELIEPVIGEDIAAFTEARYGFGYDYAEYACAR